VPYQRVERFRRKMRNFFGQASAFALRASARQAVVVRVASAFGRASRSGVDSLLAARLPSTSTLCSFRHGPVMIPACARHKQS
jgi:hypothetical protein